MDTASTILRAAGYTTPNIMTPHIIDVFKLNDDSAAELSSGEGFIRGDRIYGVTVVWHGERYGHKLSQVFYSEPLARRYIQSLIKRSEDEAK